MHFLKMVYHYNLVLPTLQIELQRDHLVMRLITIGVQTILGGDTPDTNIVNWTEKIYHIQDLNIPYHFGSKLIMQPDTMDFIIIKIIIQLLCQVMETMFYLDC